MIVYLALAGALAAAHGRAGVAPMVAAAAILAEDVVLRPAQRDGAGRVPASAPRASPCSGSAFVTIVAGHRGAGRSAAAVPVGAHLQRVGLLSGACCWPSGWKRTNAWGALAGMATGAYRCHVHGAAERDRRHHAAERAGRRRSACRWRSLPPSWCSLMTPAPGRHVLDIAARRARAGRRDAV